MMKKYKKSCDRRALIIPYQLWCGTFSALREAPMSMTRRSIVLAASLASMMASLASAQEATHAFGYEFVSVGDAGNRNTINDELIYTDPELFVPRGSVDYTFRMARTEVTAGEWLEFVNAYRPFIQPDEGVGMTTTFHRLAGRDVAYDSFTGEFVVDGVVDRAAEVEWRFAVRYVNWLHNDKNSDPLDFETGVYDTSTFGYDAKGNATHVTDPMPGARVRLPTGDEWLKAAHYDPNRYGPGQGGYWRYQHGSDTPPRFGPPGVGETDLIEPSNSLPVGSYQNAPSPWGVLDMGGTEQNWTHTVRELGALTQSDRLEVWGPGGAGIGFQEIDFVQSSSHWRASTKAFRLVAPVPSPGSFVAYGVLWPLFLMRRKR